MNSVNDFNIYTIDLRTNISKPIFEQEVNIGVNEFLSIAPSYAAINALTVHYNLNPSAIKLVFGGEHGNKTTYRYFNNNGGIDIITVTKVGQ